jgi:hypothetical protein
VRFLISVIDSQTGSATPQEMAAIDAFNEQLQSQGHWVVACGITSPSEASVIDSRGAEPVVTDGPLHDATEYITGFWLITAPDLIAAQALASDASKACNRRVELRPLLGE